MLFSLLYVAGLHARAHLHLAAVGFYQHHSSVYNLALAYEALERWELAVRTWKAATRMAPDDGEIAESLLAASEKIRA